jgi:hypothetical protein
LALMASNTEASFITLVKANTSAQAAVHHSCS